MLSIAGFGSYFLILIVYAIMSVASSNDTFVECKTERCKLRAALIRMNLDHNINPCIDFYEHICGNYIKITKVPNSISEVSARTISKQYVENAIFNRLKSLDDSKSLPKLRAFQLLQNFYLSCLQESDENSLGDGQKLFEILKTLGGWPLREGSQWDQKFFTWTDLFEKINNLGFNIHYPFEFKPRIDWVSKLKAPRVRVPENRDLYLKFITDVAKMLGAEEEPNRQELSELLEFEAELSSLGVYDEEASTKTPTKETFMIFHLNVEFPFIDWTKFLNDLIYPGATELDKHALVRVKNPVFLKRLDLILKKTPIRTQSNFMIWRLIQQALDYMPHRFYARKQQYRRDVHDFQGYIEVEQKCKNDALKKFPLANLGIYAKLPSAGNKADKVMRKMGMKILSNVKSQYLSILEKFDEHTYEDEKTDVPKFFKGLSSIIGWTDELVNNKNIEEFYKDLEIEPVNYLANFIKATQHFRRKFNSEPGAITEIAEPKVILNNFNSLLYVTPALLQEPYISAEGPTAMNYGAFGYVVGRKLAEIFYQRRTRDNILKHHLSTAECLTNQYDKYTHQDNQTLNGLLTRLENLADNAGIRVSYLAYQEWLKPNSDLKLPGLDYSPSQLFWISAASAFCRKDNGLSGEHYDFAESQKSPAKWRVNGPLANMEEFAKDFGCDYGSRMNPREKCPLW